MCIRDRFKPVILSTIETPLFLEPVALQILFTILFESDCDWLAILAQYLLEVEGASVNVPVEEDDSLESQCKRINTSSFASFAIWALWTLDKSTFCDVPVSYTHLN